MIWNIMKNDDNSLYVSEIHRNSSTSHQGFTLEQHWCAQWHMVPHADFPWFLMVFLMIYHVVVLEATVLLMDSEIENLWDKDQKWHFVFATTEQVQRHVANDESAPKYLWLWSFKGNIQCQALGLSEFIPLIHILWKGVDASYASECVFVFVCQVVWDVRLFVKEFVLVFLSICQSGCNLFCALFGDVSIWFIQYTSHSLHFNARWF